MGYPGDRQPRRQPRRPYEQSPAGEPGQEPRQEGGDSGLWPTVRDPDLQQWSPARRSGPGEGTPPGGTAPAAGGHGDPDTAAGGTGTGREFEAFRARQSGGHDTRGAGRPFEASPAPGRPNPPAPGPGPGFGAAWPDTGRAPETPGRPFEAPRPPGGSPAAPPPQPGPPAAQAGTGAFPPAQPPGRPFSGPEPAGAGPDRSREQPAGHPAAAGPGPAAARTASARSRAERPGEPYLGEPRSRGPLYLAGGVIAMIGALVAVILVMNQDDDPVPTATAPASARPSVAPPPPAVGDAKGEYGLAASRKTDPQPLTLNEVFGRKKITVGARTYQMTVRRSDKKCGTAVHGTGLQKALTAGRCTQFLRASFRDGTGKLIGTVGVANLSTANAAKKAAKAGSGGELEDYVNPLQGKDSVTKFLGGGGDSYATAWPQGHYLVLLWFQYKDGHKPSKAELKRLNTAAVDIVEKAVFSALDTRALTGARTS
ncbi:hypothetical protein Sru01_06240 [Sphaerisporangium rufum]|uniref:Uncharacterized protein n=1 Tax=Sphaerisporangium rufum TaxID=1381558 RepID=A0A919UYY0_9ACTN|nr:hypothetical protein [Sphaerisporangium rufum]GII75642.1 hypothetical protein Sru01_06240 [Sphaerisporangium rufum]